MFLSVGCGKESAQNEDTEFLNAGAGISFQGASEEMESGDGSAEDIEITAEDLEGRTEETVVTIMSAKVYAKPSETASVIGTVARGNQVGIYGLSEDEKWVVVSFNGRIGYISSEVIEEEVRQNQEVIISTPPSQNQGTGNVQPETPSGSVTNPFSNSETGNPSNSETETPSSSEIETPKDTEIEVPSDSETEAPEDTETEVPSDSETEAPEDTEIVVPGDSETEVPEDVLETSEEVESDESGDME